MVPWGAVRPAMASGENKGGEEACPLKPLSRLARKTLENGHGGYSPQRLIRAKRLACALIACASCAQERAGS